MKNHISTKLTMILVLILTLSLNSFGQTDQRVRQTPNPTLSPQQVSNETLSKLSSLQQRQSGLREIDKDRVRAGSSGYGEFGVVALENNLDEKSLLKTTQPKVIGIAAIKSSSSRFASGEYSVWITKANINPVIARRKQISALFKISLSKFGTETVSDSEPAVSLTISNSNSSDSMNLPDVLLSAVANIVYSVSFPSTKWNNTTMFQPASFSSLFASVCDNFVNVCTIPGSLTSWTVSDYLIGSTGETSEPVAHTFYTTSQNPLGTNWYHWTAPQSGTVIVNTQGTNPNSTPSQFMHPYVVDTTLAVYTGPTIGNLTRIDESDDWVPSSPPNSSCNFARTLPESILSSCMMFTVTAGTTYHFQVDGLNYANISNGNSLLNLYYAPPSNTTNAAAKDYFGSNVAIYGRHAVVGIPQCDQQNNTNTGTGKVQIYEFNNPNWNLIKTINGTNAGDCFGQSVAIWANTLIVGANKFDVGSNQNQGQAYIYERQLGGNNNYGLSKTLVVPVSDAMADDQFGVSVDISGDYAIIGARNAEPIGGISNQGQAYIFERNHTGTNNWGLKDSLRAFENTPTNINVNDHFGYSVAIDVNGTAVVGAIVHDEPMKADQGAAYVFERQTVTPFNWQKLEKLYDSTPNAKAGDYFGCSVAISGNTIIVGAFQADAPILNQGAAFIYTKSGGSWISQIPYKLTTSQTPNQGDNFGYSVDIWNDNVVVGAYYDEMPLSGSPLQNQGVTYFAKRNSGGWTSPIAFSGNPTGGTDLFGSDVAIWDSYFIVGSPLSDIGTNQDQGSAYIFNSALGTQVKHLF